MNVALAVKDIKVIFVVVKIKKPMKSTYLDIEYLELMLQKAFKVTFTYEKIKDFHIGKLRYVYNDERIAYTALYYLVYSLKNETTAISLQLTKENTLVITLDVWDKAIKIITHANSCNWTDLSLMIGNADFPCTNDSDVIVNIGCEYQTKWEPMPIYLMDKSLGNGHTGLIKGYLQKYDNDGHQITPPPEVSF